MDQHNTHTHSTQGAQNLQNLQHTKKELESLRAQLPQASRVSDYQRLMGELRALEGPLLAANSDAEPPLSSRPSARWGALLDAMGLSRELEGPLELLTRRLEGDAEQRGLTPIKGWGRCYDYFEAVSEHLKALEELSQRVEEDPAYLQLALEALKLRALSQRVHAPQSQPSNTQPSNTQETR